MKYVRNWAVALTVSLFVSFAHAKDTSVVQQEDVRIPRPAPGTTDIYHYIVELLTRALAVTEREYGQLKIVTNPETTPQQRQLMNLSNGNTDIAWSITSAERESRYTPVRVPLIGGLFGYRVFLVRADDNRFDYAPSLPDLKAMTAIQGANWPDTHILQYNEFSVLGTYGSGHLLLHRKMVDYFPRAIHEVTQELLEFPQFALNVAPQLALKYDNPMFFFVSKNHPRLAERLAKGLTTLYNNGEMLNLLTQQPFYADAEEMLFGREIYLLQNPLLTNETKAALAQFR